MTRRRSTAVSALALAAFLLGTGSVLPRTGRASPPATPAAGPRAAEAPAPASAAASSPAAAPASQAAPADDETLTFLEGPAPADTARVGGGARGAGGGPNVFLLVSQRVGKTVREQPTIYWYLTGPTDSDVDLVVSKPGDEAPTYRRRLRSQQPLAAGLHAFPLAGTSARLEVGARYQVTVTVWANSRDPSQNPFSTGFIERVPTPPDLAALGPEPDARACAAAGLWYDALDALGREIERHPADPRPRRQRRQLLRDQHVFLTFSPKAEWEKIPGVRRSEEEADRLERERLDGLAGQDEREAEQARDRR